MGGAGMKAENGMAAIPGSWRCDLAYEI
jgi:hypothetical protein